MGDFKKSKDIYYKGLSLIEKDTSKSGIRLKASLHANLAWAMRNLEEEAYDHLEISYNIKDSLRDLKTQEMLKRVEGEYNVNAVRQEEQIKDNKPNVTHGLLESVVYLSSSF